MTNLVLRRALGAVALTTGVALAATGCASSSNGNPITAGSSAVGGAASSVAAGASSAVAGASSAAAGASSAAASAVSSAAASASSASSGTAGSSGSKSAFCADLDRLVTLSGQVVKEVGTSGNPSTANFGKLKSTYNDLAKLGTSLAADAPSAIASSAKDYNESINALNLVVQSSSSAADVQRKVLANASLKAATTKLTTASTKLVGYKTKTSGC